MHCTKTGAGWNWPAGYNLPTPNLDYWCSVQPFLFKNFYWKVDISAKLTSFWGFFCLSFCHWFLTHTKNKARASTDSASKDTQTTFGFRFSPIYTVKRRVARGARPCVLISHTKKVVTETWEPHVCRVSHGIPMAEESALGCI